MKVGFNMLLWTTHVTDDDLPLLESIKKAGYDGVEIPIFEGDPAHFEKVGQAIKEFETVDELYTCLAGDTTIKVLATARSKVDDKDYPMAFVLDYGKGHVFHSVLGHDVQALANPDVGRLFRNDCAWGAGLKPRTNEPVKTNTNRNK